MDLAELTQRAQEAVKNSDFKRKVKFDFPSVGKLFIDGEAEEVSNEDKQADATIKVDWDDFIAIAKGEMDPTRAFMGGKLKLDGDMSVAMQLQSLFQKMR